MQGILNTIRSTTIALANDQKVQTFVINAAKIATFSLLGGFAVSATNRLVNEKPSNLRSFTLGAVLGGLWGAAYIEGLFNKASFTALKDQASSLSFRSIKKLD